MRACAEVFLSLRTRSCPGSECSSQHAPPRTLLRSSPPLGRSGVLCSEDGLVFSLLLLESLSLMMSYCLQKRAITAAEREGVKASPTPLRLPQPAERPGPGSPGVAAPHPPGVSLDHPAPLHVAGPVSSGRQDTDVAEATRACAQCPRLGVLRPKADVEAPRGTVLEVSEQPSGFECLQQSSGSLVQHLRTHRASPWLCPVSQTECTVMVLQHPSHSGHVLQRGTLDAGLRTRV